MRSYVSNAKYYKYKDNITGNTEGKSRIDAMRISLCRVKMIAETVAHRGIVSSFRRGIKG